MTFLVADEEVVDHNKSETKTSIELPDREREKGVNGSRINYEGEHNTSTRSVRAIQHRLSFETPSICSRTYSPTLPGQDRRRNKTNKGSRRSDEFRLIPGQHAFVPNRHSDKPHISM